MHPFLEKYTAGLPATAPPVVLGKLADIGPLGSTPKSGAQGSAMLTSGVHPLAASIKYHGGLTPANLKHCQQWLAEQLRWRWNGDATLNSGTAKYATDPAGRLLVNSKGEWITIDRTDAQHSDVDAYLVLASVAGEPLPLRMAHSIVYELADEGVYDAASREPNTRYHTNTLRMLRSWYLATGDPNALRWAKNIVLRLAHMMGYVGTFPHLTLNTKAKDDHKELDVNCWMSTRAAQALDEWEPIFGGLTPIAEAVRQQARTCLIFAEERAKTQPGYVPHSMLADWEGPSGVHPEGAVNYFAGNAMTRWSMLARAKMDPEGTRAWYLASDFCNPTDKNWMGHHNAGISIPLAGLYGWRE